MKREKRGGHKMFAKSYQLEIRIHTIYYCFLSIDSIGTFSLFVKKIQDNFR